jgi:hypothetical protein
MEMILLLALQVVTVEAGAHDRVNVPVSVALASDAKTAVLTDVAGKKIPGQVADKTLHFIVPELKAGQKAEYAVAFGAVEGPAFKWSDVELKYGERPVLRYMNAPLDPAKREETYKVFHHVYSPDGSRLLTKGAGGQFTHHRGVFYGFNKVTYGEGKSCDVWHCSKDAHQAHDTFLGAEEGPVLGRHRLGIRWNGVGKDVFAVETRELTAWAVPGGILLDFASSLEAKIGPVKLDGDPQHAGFHFRADNEVSAKTSKQTVYTRPDGSDKAGATRNWPGNKEHVNLAWNSMSFVLDDKRYTAVYLDRPENPKEARFSERDYGRFGSYFAATVEAGKPLLVRYRLWIQEGQPDVAACAAKHADFIDPPKVSVK